MREATHNTINIWHFQVPANFLNTSNIVQGSSPCCWQIVLRRMCVFIGTMRKNVAFIVWSKLKKDWCDAILIYAWLSQILICPCLITSVSLLSKQDIYIYFLCIFWYLHISSYMLTGYICIYYLYVNRVYTYILEMGVVVED